LQKPNSILNFITTNNELQIVKAVELGQRIETLTDKTSLLQCVSRWRLYIGLPKEDVTQELTIITEFIFKSYGHLTIQEVDLAVQLSVTRQLEDCEFYGNFSPLYVGKVLSAYLYHRKLTMADAVRRKEVFDMEAKEKESKPTPEQECELTKDIIKDFYNQYKEIGEITDLFNICYNLFRKLNLIKPDKGMIDEAMKYGKEMASKGTSRLNFKELLKHTDNMTKVYARNYCVQKYFDKIEIEELLAKITPNLFADAVHQGNNI